MYPGVKDDRFRAESSGSATETAKGVRVIVKIGKKTVRERLLETLPISPAEDVRSENE